MVTILKGENNMKTFYSVNYREWGADQTYTKWFDNKEEAINFARRDYADYPVAHRYSNFKSIADAGMRVMDSKFGRV